MSRGEYYRLERSQPGRKRRKWLILGIIIALLAGGLVYKFILSPDPVQQAVDQLQFDDSFTDSEKQTVQTAIKDQSKTYSGELSASVSTSFDAAQTALILDAYVPVADAYASRQLLSKDELAGLTVYVPQNTDDKIRAALATTLGIDAAKLIELAKPVEDMPAGSVAFIPASQLSPTVKLLTFEGSYYLDDFQKGAVFRQVVYSGSDSAAMNDLKLNNLASKDSTLKINMSGVTALTRVMQRKLASVSGPTYFSELIGDYLADADITHVSNEVSFMEGCAYSTTSFCSPPEFIETLKDSGVDLVEITGNHNNDKGNSYNTSTINLYHSLGWSTFGGGLNSSEAAKPYVADQKGSKITFIGYNLADGAGSGAIAGNTTAGANIYSEDKAKADITAAKQNSQFVIVDIQYSECQAYPSGYVEFPQCDGPIGGQEEAFRQMIDFGADMVIGSSAHQPQTYEMYKDKWIYYGLGNQYFDQTQWPGTERGIILSHYFAGGKHVQTKLSPTVYDKDLQTHLLDNEEAVYLLDRLDTARP